MKRFTAEAFAALSRRRGFNVDRPAKEHLEAQLRETLERLRAGESLADLSRCDDMAPLAAALERPLAEDEALRVLASNQYLEHCLAAAEGQIASFRASAEHQRESANLWGQACADMGRAFDEIAAAAGDVVLGQEPQRLVEVVRSLLQGRLPEGTITVDDGTFAKALLLVAQERRAQREKWGKKAMAVSGRPLTEPKHALAVLLEEVGEVARTLLDHEGDERLLAELVQVAAVASVWVELLLRNQEQVPWAPMESSAAEHAAASVETTQSEGAPVGRAPTRTGLPRDATTAALVAASNELHEHRVAASLLASSLGDPALAEDPRRLAERVAETIEAAEATHDDGEAAHQETIDLLTRVQGENAQLCEKNREVLELLGKKTHELAQSERILSELRDDLETEQSWRPVDVDGRARGWVVVTGEEQPCFWAVFDSEDEAHAFVTWRQENAQHEDDRDPSWECASVLPAEFPEGFPVRFWNSYDPAPGTPSAADDEAQP